MMDSPRSFSAADLASLAALPIVRDECIESFRRNFRPPLDPNDPRERVMPRCGPFPHCVPVSIYMNRFCIHAEYEPGKGLRIVVTEYVRDREP